MRLHKKTGQPWISTIGLEIHAQVISNAIFVEAMCFSSGTSYYRFMPINADCRNVVESSILKLLHFLFLRSRQTQNYFLVQQQIQELPSTLR